MTDPGLNQRLRQRSRRAGFMIGVSMALTIAVCVGGFSFLYAALDNTFADFISEEVPTAVVPTDTPTEEPAEEVAQNQDQPTEEPEATEPPADEEATEESTPDTGEFVPDYQVISSVESLNFRSEPSTAGQGDTIITTIAAGTPLMFLDERRESENPDLDGDGGEGWMFFQLEDGTEGWLRTIDVEEIEP